MIAVYARQSVDKKDSISIETQIEFCKKQFADEKYKVYKDKGYSGSNINRPAFEKMVDDIKCGKIEKVIVYRIDRISRSLLDFANIIDMFSKYNVEFLSSTEKFDTSTPIGRAMLNIIMVFAQLERETIQLRIKDNYYSRGKLGMYMGGQIPFGYIKIPYPLGGRKASTYGPNPDNIDFLKEIYEMYSLQQSCGEITKYLNDKNIKTASGGIWANNKVSRILRNPCYVKADADIYSYYKNLGVIIDNDISDFVGVYGCFLYGRTDRDKNKYTKDSLFGQHLCISVHEGVIDSKMWLECQYKLDNSVCIKNNGKGKLSWLSGLTKCAKCNYAMVARNTGKKEHHKYFYCKGKYAYKICDTTAGPNVVIMEQYIEGLLLERIKMLRDVKYEENQIENSEINDIKLKIFQIDEKIDKLLSQLEEDAIPITIKYVNQRLEKLDTEKNSLCKQLDEKTGNKVEGNKELDLIKSVSLSDWPNMTVEEKKNIAKFMIKKINIGEDTIDIDWKH